MALLSSELDAGVTSPADNPIRGEVCWLGPLDSSKERMEGGRLRGLGEGEGEVVSKREAGLAWERAGDWSAVTPRTGGAGRTGLGSDGWAPFDRGLV